MSDCFSPHCAIGLPSAARARRVTHRISNAQMESNLIRKYCEIDSKGALLLKNAMNKLNLSARAYDRILKVSRTIADLGGSESIQIEHLAEAIHYRSLDRENWGA